MEHALLIISSRFIHGDITPATLRIKSQVNQSSDRQKYHIRWCVRARYLRVRFYSRSVPGTINLISWCSHISSPCWLIACCQVRVQLDNTRLCGIGEFDSIFRVLQGLTPSMMQVARKWLTVAVHWCMTDICAVATIVMKLLHCSFKTIF